MGNFEIDEGLLLQTVTNGYLNCEERNNGSWHIQVERGSNKSNIKGVIGGLLRHYGVTASSVEVYLHNTEGQEIQTEYQVSGRRELYHTVGMKGKEVTVEGVGATDYFRIIKNEYKKLQREKLLKAGGSFGWRKDVIFIDTLSQIDEEVFNLVREELNELLTEGSEHGIFFVLVTDRESTLEFEGVTKVIISEFGVTVQDSKK